MFVSRTLIVVCVGAFLCAAEPLSEAGVNDGMSEAALSELFSRFVDKMGDRRPRSGFGGGTLLACCVCSFITAISLCGLFARIFFPLLVRSLSDSKGGRESEEATLYDNNRNAEDEEDREARLQRLLQQIEHVKAVLTKTAKESSQATLSKETKTHETTSALRQRRGQRTQQQPEHDACVAGKAGWQPETMLQEYQELGSSSNDDEPAIAQTFENEVDDMSVPSDSGEEPSHLAEAKRIRQQIESSRTGEVKAKQHEFENECRQSFAVLKKIVEGNSAVAEGELAKSVKTIRSIFERIDQKFSANAPARITAMILCCNVIMDCEGLTLLQNSKNVDSGVECDAQWVIEKVVPHIWSM